MPTFNEQANDFLTQKRIAVVGVSRNENGVANGIYRRLRDSGYEVYAVNPKAQTCAGDPCYPSVKDIPAPLDGAFIMTNSEVSTQVVADCIEAGVPRIWMHENAWAGKKASSVSDEAVELCNQKGVKVIAGGCPMMFLEFGHKCMKFIMGLTGHLPK